MYQARTNKARRQPRRRTRLVTEAMGDLSFFGPAGMSENEAITWSKGLWGAQLFQEYFPEEFAAHIAPHPATLPRLLIASEAFLGLVSERLFEQCYEEVYDTNRLLAMMANPPEIPMDTVIGTIGELQLHYIIPTCFGIGVQSIHNNIYDESYFEYGFDMLTLAIWSTFEGTAWGIPIPDCVINDLEPSQRDYLSRLPRLPYLTEDEIAEGLAQLQLTHEGKAISGEHIRYVFGHTDNPMADFTNAELDDIGANYNTWRDADAVQIAVAWQEAEQLATSYHAWANAVSKAPNRHIPTIIGALFVVFAPFGAKLPKPIKPSAKLIDLLIPEEPDATTTTAQEIEALATA